MYKKALYGSLIGALAIALCLNSKLSGGYVSPIGEKATYDFPGKAQWKTVETEGGDCSLQFPKSPEHIKQRLQVKEDQELLYDVYVSDYERKEVFMILIAQYPTKIPEMDAQRNLEHFLNRLIAQNQNNRLVFADLINVQGYKGLEFFIRTNQVYFKGRVIQANNTLYLLAMECEAQNYHEGRFHHFIDSCHLHINGE